MPAENIKSPKLGMVYRSILWALVAIMTLPIFYLPMANGQMSLALTYVIGAPLLTVISMFVLGWLDGTKEAEDF